MPKIEVTAAELAASLCVSVRHLERLVAGGVVPKPTQGRFDALEAVQAYLRHTRVDSDGRSARAEAARATALRARIQARTMMGSLLAPDEMATVFATLAGQHWTASQRAASLVYSDLTAQLPGYDVTAYRTITSIFHEHLKDWIRASRDATLDALDKLPAALRDDQRIDDLLRQLEDADVTPAPKRRRKAKP